MKPGGRIAPMPVGRAEPPRPHIYLLEGEWRVCRSGRRLAHGLVDARRPTFREACHLAMLAAIHSGVWRA